MTHAGCRISRVRPKNSQLAEVVVLKPEDSKRRQRFLDDCRKVMNAHPQDIDGYAVVVWARDNASTCFAIGGSSMPSILVPDFVRARLLAYKICRWAMEDTLESLGYGPPMGEGA